MQGRVLVALPFLCNTLRIATEITSPFTRACHCEALRSNPLPRATRLLRRGLLAMTRLGKLFRPRSLHFLFFWVGGEGAM